MDFRLDREGIIEILQSRDPELDRALREEAYRVKVGTVGAKVYLRGLVEISNICRKNCLYCGIRRDMPCRRYELSEEEVLRSARTAAERRWGSIVIQGGERRDAEFVSKITRLIRSIKSIETGGEPLGITLSLGEQSREVYQEWFDAGAHRYLLRIEASNPDLYRKIHPSDDLHSYDRRLRALMDLKEIGWQAGTGAMIGLPFQTAGDMADDLLFYKEFDAPMIGMGPYIPHDETPLASEKYPSDAERFTLALKMIALLRLLMPDINIASATALEAMNPRGRELGILSGANVIMPNLTPGTQRVKYDLYKGKTSVKTAIPEDKFEIGYGEWGDSLHFKGGNR